MYEFFNIKNEYGCAANTYVSVYGSNRACRTHLHGSGRNAFHAFFAVRFDNFQRTVYSAVINTNEKRGVAVQKETACGGHLGDLETFGCQACVDKVRIVIVYDCDNQFHKNFPCPCCCKGFLSFDICIGLSACFSANVHYYLLL